MYVNKELYQKIILYVGDVENNKTYFPTKEVKIEPYTENEIYNHLALMIEGKLLQGIFAEDESSDKYGYLIGGLTTETRYLYHQIKKGNIKENINI